MLLHSLIKPEDNHPFYTWSHATVSEMYAAAKYTNDIGKVTWVTDTNSFFVLVSVPAGTTAYNDATPTANPTTADNWVNIFSKNYISSVAVEGDGLQILSPATADAVALITSNATSNNVPDTTVFRDSTGSFAANIVTADLTGKATSADRLHTARTISFSGDITGSAVFDGSDDITIITTIGSNSIVLGTDTSGNYVAAGATSGNGISGAVDTEGGVFTVTSNATAAPVPDTIVYRDGSGNFAAGVITATEFIGSFRGDVHGNADTATKLATPRTINGVSFDGSANITLPDQVITLTGDVTGSGTGTFATTLSNTTVIPNTYTNANITVDSKGRLIAASNGTAGTVTSVSVTSANGVSGSVLNSTTTPAITLTLGAITPTSVAASGTVTGSNLSGTNTGDQTITLTGDVTGTGTGSFPATLSTTGVTAGSYTNATITVDNKGRLVAAASGSVGNAGTVTSVSVTSANGISGSVLNPTTTPAITLTLGAITPTSVAASGTVTGSNLSGTNTGDQTITLTGDVTGSGKGSFAATLANSGVAAGSYTLASITVDSKGRVTAASSGSGGGGTATTATNLAGGSGGYIPYQTAANTTAFFGPMGAAGAVLMSSGGSTPMWSNTVNASIASSNLNGGFAGQVPYQSAPNTTAFTPVGIAGYVLTSNGSAAPSWQPSGTATTASNLAGGSAGTIVYQSSTGVTAYLPMGSAGQVLSSNGTATPVWQTPASGNPTITNDTTTNSTHYINFTSSFSGAFPIKASSSKLLFNPSTGALTAGGDITAYSDARLKTELVQISGALGKIKQLTGYTFTRLDTGVRQMGLIAQDVEKVAPEVVDTSGEYMSVAYGNLVGMLVEAIKDLEVRLTAIESKLV